MILFHEIRHGRDRRNFEIDVDEETGCQPNSSTVNGHSRGERRSSQLERSLGDEIRKKRALDAIKQSAVAVEWFSARESAQSTS